MADYIANTSKNRDILYQIASEARMTGSNGILQKNASASEITQALKSNVDAKNEYGSTIGNATLNQYGYYVTKDGTIKKKEEKKATTTAASTVGNTNSSTGTSTKQTTVEPTLTAEEEQTKSINDSLGDYSTIYTNYSQMQDTGNSSLEAAKATAAENINNQYDDNAADYYRLYKTAQAQLPTNLSKVGATGGATETAQLALLNNYSNNLYSNESDRASALASSNVNYDTQIATNSQNLASTLAESYLTLAKQAKSDADDAAATKAESDATAAETKAEEEKETKKNTWNTNVTNAIAKKLKEGKTVYSWFDNDGYRHWTMSKSQAESMKGMYTVSTLKLEEDSKKKVVDSSDNGEKEKEETPEAETPQVETPVLEQYVKTNTENKTYNTISASINFYNDNYANQQGRTGEAMANKKIDEIMDSISTAQKNKQITAKEATTLKNMIK